MKRIPSIILTTLAFISSCFLTRAQSIGSLNSMNLVGPGTGWAATERRLFWTTDGGSTWKNITPSSDLTTIDDVVFSNHSTGWVLLSGNGADSSSPRFVLATTTDAGASWTNIPLALPSSDDPEGTELSGTGHIDFTDPLHGWLHLDVASSSSAHRGLLVYTRDGGRTWAFPRAQPPTGGNIRFVGTRNGWTVAPNGEALYVTHDTSKSWQEVSLRAPAEAKLATEATYELPSFENEKRGFMSVMFSGSGTNAILVVYETIDGGETWKSQASLPQADAGWAMVPSSVSATRMIFVRSLNRTLEVTFIRHEETGISEIPERLVASVDENAVIGSVWKVQFATDSEGWILGSAPNGCAGSTTCVRLLATSNRGATWSVITPAAVRGVPGTKASSAIQFPGKPLGANAKPLVRGNVSSLSPDISHPAKVSVHIGFDISKVLPTGDMQTWWSDSPYWDTSVYLPGAANRSNDANLTAAWVTAVQGQGWGLIPIWFGLQSPCACKTSNPCVPYSQTFSATVATAAMQGALEADAATASATKLGISNSIIYHDIENYTPSGSCSPAVVAFLGGWVTEMHSKSGSNTAGVYGNPSPANTDFSKVSPLPDDVWIAKSDSRRTIWGLGVLRDSLWSVDQRIHQYLLNNVQSYGSSAQYKIDADIEDAAIVLGNGDKNYTFNYTDLQYPGSEQTIATGLNNTGDVVGYYNVAGHLTEGFGFEYDTATGAFTPINYPNATTTEPLGINDAGVMVGIWNNSSTGGAFMYSGGTFSDLPSEPGSGCTLCTLPWTINDDNQISGFYIDSSGNHHGFLYNAGVYTTNDYPGSGNWDELYGINGLFHASGCYGLAPGACYGGYYYDGGTSALPYQTFFWTPQLNTTGHGINNDDRMTGEYEDQNGYMHGFYYSFGIFYSIDDPSAIQTFAYGINDGGQIAGYYAPSSMLPTYPSFIATPVIH